MEITALLFLSVWSIVKTSPLSKMSNVQKQMTRISGKGAEEGVAMGRGWRRQRKGPAMKTRSNKNNNISQLNFQNSFFNS